MLTSRRVGMIVERDVEHALIRAFRSDVHLHHCCAQQEWGMKTGTGVGREHLSGCER